MNCEWSAWQTDACSVTCGEGTFTKNRSKAVIENYGGICTGRETMKKKCNNPKCEICKWLERVHLNAFELTLNF